MTSRRQGCGHLWTLSSVRLVVQSPLLWRGPPRRKPRTRHANKNKFVVYSSSLEYLGSQRRREPTCLGGVELTQNVMFCMPGLVFLGGGNLGICCFGGEPVRGVAMWALVVRAPLQGDRIFYIF